MDSELVSATVEVIYSSTCFFSLLSSGSNLRRREYVGSKNHILYIYIYIGQAGTYEYDSTQQIKKDLNCLSKGPAC